MKCSLITFVAFVVVGVCSGCLPSVNLHIPTMDPTIHLPPLDKGERIVMDRNKMMFEGVPLDPRYSETPIEGRYTSAAGCPKSYKGHPWVTYKDRCYLAGFQGPCPDYMKMFLVQGSANGKCDCECFHQNSVRNHCHLSNHFVHVANVNGTCHRLLFQGPCRNNEWLVMDKEGRPRCEMRLCPVSTLKVVHYYTFYDEFTHHCAVNQGKCSHVHFYTTNEENWIPVCKGVMKIGPTQPPNESCQLDYVLGECLGKFNSVRRTERRQICHWIGEE